MEEFRSRVGTGIAGRAGAWSASRWKRAVGLWFAFVLAALVVGSGVGQKKLTQAGSMVGDSAQAQQILEDADFEEPAAENVVIHSERLTASEASFRATITAVARRIRGFEQVTAVRTPFDEGGETLISRDRHSALVQFDLRGKAEKAEKHVQPLVEAVALEQRARPGFRIEEVGNASATHALNETIGKDYRRAELLSLPLTLVILLLAFGALVAALVPMMLAVTAIMAATGIVGLTSHALPVDGSTSSMLLLIGLAVGVDYSLFYVRREQEERAHGASPRSALLTAASTSGRAVLTSGLTVIVAIAGLFLTGIGTFEGMGSATAIVVAVAVLGSVSVLPALLSGLGDRVERGRIPYLGKRLERGRVGGSRFWHAVLRPVLAHPRAAAAVSAAFLLFLAGPALRLHTAIIGTNEIPKDLPIMKTYDRVQAAFPGGAIPAVVVVSAPDVTAPAVTSSIDELRRRATASGRMFEPVTVRINPHKTVAAIDIPVAGDGTNARSRAAIDLLRKTLVPQTVGRTATEAHVSGDTAGSQDFNSRLSSRAPLVFAFVLGLAFLLLLWAFRSLVIAATAVVLNMLSVAAAYGVLVAVFQWGWGGSLIGLTWHGAITSWLPLFMFVVLFGLSMDYHVFILSRIREARDGGARTRDAIEAGITSSAGVVTSAAIVMVAVFSTFATLSMVSMKQLGVGLAVAVLLDATIVRAVLLPATMEILGEKNWYLPRWLGWLPGSAPDRRIPVAKSPASVGARAR
jgi:putative drug exporter of the RND superfamily